MTPHAPLLAPRHATLPASHYREVIPQPLLSPRPGCYNTALARSLGLPPALMEQDPWFALLAGNNTDRPALATLYAGHQFGVFVSQLGDGRALLLGDVLDAAGQRQELQLKGAGLTPFSRMGDGRAVVRSSVREYLCSEAMHGLGIATTRALSLLLSQTPVRRERLEKAAVVARVAPSFVRFGHFEVFYHRGQYDDLRALADFVIREHFPQCLAAPQPYLAFFDAVCERTATLLAQWQAVGFCHGVMNTDNMSILGLTIDYGPFGFLDGFDLEHVCNHSDHSGRYAFNQQPEIAHWNLYCLASALLPLLDEASLRQSLARYPARYAEVYLDKMRAKLGLLRTRDDDEALLAAWLRILDQYDIDYTLAHRELADFRPDVGRTPCGVLVAHEAALAAWLMRYGERLRWEDSDDDARAALMRAHNPRFILRNHLAEQAIRALEDDGDASVLHALLDCLARPYDEQPQYQAFAAPAPAWAADLCVSCSS